MTDVMEVKGEALMAGGHEPLDAEAFMEIIRVAEEVGRAPGLNPEDYTCPVHLEQPDGELKRRLSPTDVGRLAEFWNAKVVGRLFSGQIEAKPEEDSVNDLINRPRAREFVEKSRDWLQDCVEKRRPVFVRTIELGRIALSPLWTKE